MSIDSQSLRKLASLNLSPEQMSGVLDLLADNIEKEEQRKKLQAERSRRSRARNVTATLPQHDEAVTVTNDDSHIENARAPDSLILQVSKKVSKNTGSRFSLTSIPPEWISFCKQKRPDLDPSETFDAFRDWWIAQPGGKGVKLDWFATWRTWIRNQKRQGNYQNAKPSEPKKSNVITL